MKISTKGRYGLRAMLDIAINSNGEYITLKTISKREEISEDYLEHVFSILRKANLVKSIKGSQGGYVLKDRPSEITISSILYALEISLIITRNPLSEISGCHNSQNVYTFFNGQYYCIKRFIDSINNFVICPFIF